MQNDIPYQADITSENHQKKIYCIILETKFKIMYVKHKSFSLQVHKND